MKKKLMTLLATLMALALLLTACGVPAPSAELSNGAVGTVLLSVNPEIEIEYDRNGLVVELEGRNADGKEVLLSYRDFEGKTVKEVLSELVELIYTSGKYDLEMNGNGKNIVVKLENGSAYPDEKFLEEIAESIRQITDSQGSQSETVVVDKTDLKENGLIGLEKAKELVLTQLGLAEATFTQKEYDLEDGVYELEFTAGGMEYEFEVDARTGKVLESDTEPAGPTPTIPAAPGITLEEAKALVFAQLGITEADIREPEYDLEDGIYELEFKIGRMEYDFEVDAATGKILKMEQDIDD